jgi:hypothetical protein
MLAGAVLLAGVLASDTRPALVAYKAQDAAKERAAVDRLQQASLAVVERLRAAEAAKRELRASRREARAAHDQLDALRQEAAAHRGSATDDDAMTQYRRELRLGRAVTLVLLVSFAFLNGVARRSLSSSGPSLVDAGLLTEKRIDAIFSCGFEAFAIGKGLVVPILLLLGPRRSMLLQLCVLTLSMGSYLLAPGSDAVQIGAWVVFRIFSAMAVSVRCCPARCRLRPAACALPRARCTSPLRPLAAAPCADTASDRGSVVPAHMVRPCLRARLHRLPGGLPPRLLLLAGTGATADPNP